jgi:hypothetical protein
MRSLPPPLTSEQNSAVHETRLEDLLTIARRSLDEKNPSPAMIRASADILKQIMTLQGTAAKEESAVMPNQEAIYDWADRVLGLKGLSLPIEGDPFAPEDVVLAEIVTEEEEHRSIVREIRHFPVPAEAPAEDAQYLDPEDILRRFQG